MPQEKDKDAIPKRLWRKLKTLEKQMRAEIPTWERVREYQEKIEVVYATKLMETYLFADLGASGNVRDLYVRQFTLEKLMEFYRW